MPELPEVEVIRRELDSKILNQTIEQVEIHWNKTFVNLCDDSPSGKTIVKTNRRGKYIIFDLDQNYLIVHLRMTGQLIYSTSDDSSKNHLRASIYLQSGSVLNFYDARKFGRIYYTKELDSFFNKVGVDALSLQLDASYFTDLVKQKKQGIKAFLLDQQNIAGLGNIYIDECLFLSNIHPRKTTNSISNNQAQNLFTNIKKVLNCAIDNMGTTISDYRTTGGGFGNNQSFLKVYKRQDEPCFICGTSIQKIRINSRGTHFCPVCQPENGVHK